MKQLVISLATLVTFTGLSIAPVFAAGDATPTPTMTVLKGTSSYGTTGYGTSGYGVPCTPGYGGECAQPGNISINKLVLDPRSDDQMAKGGNSSEVFVENLGPSDNRYLPGEATAFKLIVTNTGNKTLTNVVVRDVFPQYVTFVSGTGTFDNNTYSFTINSLEAGQSTELIVRGKIANFEQLPNNNVTCVINKAEATADGKTAQDNAQLCIEKQLTTKGGQPIFPKPEVKSTPATGAGALSLLALIPAAISGLLLRKRANNK